MVELGMPIQVSRVTWWMQHYGSGTPKRQYMYSNSSAIGSIDRGRLLVTKPGKKKKRACGKDAKANAKKTVRHYVNSEGKRCWTGTEFLKRTEYLASSSAVHKPVRFLLPMLAS